MDKQVIIDFLYDQTRRELAVIDGKYPRLLLKARYDAHVDFLYMLSQYDSAHPIAIGQKADYSGFISYSTKQVYDVGSELRNLLGISWEERNDCDFISEIAREEVTERIRLTVNGRPVPITSESEELRDEGESRKRHEEYGAQSEAFDWFYKRQAGVYTPHIRMDRWSTAQIIRFIHDRDAFVAEEAQAFIKKNARSINYRLWALSLSQKAYAALESTPGDHHLRRAIAACLGDAKKVTVHLNKDGQVFEGKIAADTLRRVNDSDYFIYHMDAADRKRFEATFGRSARLHAADIAKITYGKKTLYEQSAVQMPG